jgi:hypothetical protein
MKNPSNSPRCLRIVLNGQRRARNARNTTDDWTAADERFERFNGLWRDNFFTGKRTRFNAATTLLQYRQR